jgi:hypothetical protein
MTTSFPENFLRRIRGGLIFLCFVATPNVAFANEHAHHQHHAMVMDRDGMVMNSNEQTLPQDCKAISAELKFDVRVGRKYARRGLTYGFDHHEWRAPPCARIQVTLINEDQIRHQWMVHGLPRYIYPQGMFHLEANGGTTRTGTFIVPSDDRTYLAHCDISHHMEQGLKAQLLVGSGSGTLPSIPGISAAVHPDRYE